MEAPPPDARALDLEALRPRMTALARRFTRTPDAAEDIVQNAFLKAIRADGDFEGRAQYSTWVHRIVVNEALIWLRRERRHRRRLQGLADLCIDPPSPGWDDADAPDRQLSERRRAEALRRRVAELPRHERHVIEACALGGESYADYARALGISTATAKTRAFRARQHLARAAAQGLSNTA